MRSSLEIHDLVTGESRVVHATDRLIEAPNWSPDGRFLVFNGDGRLFRLELEARPIRSRSTPASPPAATTTTASRPTAAAS